jgi:hypothetical protein
MLSLLPRGGAPIYPRACWLAATLLKHHTTARGYQASMQTAQTGWCRSRPVLTEGALCDALFLLPLELLLPGASVHGPRALYSRVVFLLRGNLGKTPGSLLCLKHHQPTAAQCGQPGMLKAVWTYTLHTSMLVELQRFSFAALTATFLLPSQYKRRQRHQSKVVPQCRLSFLALAGALAAKSLH